MPGFCVTVRIKDKTVFSQAYGVADIETQAPLTTSHYFAMASQTKIITALAITQLAERRLLRLDDAVGLHLPWLHDHPDARTRQMSIRHLLQHSSGLLRDGPNSDYWLDARDFPSDAQLRKLVLRSAIVFSPGTGLKYSNLGFALLGQIIARVSGVPYEQYVAAKIIRPLKLQAVIADKNNRPDLVVQGYGLLFEHQRQALEAPFALATLSPAAGLYATTEDMCRLFRVFSGSHSFLAQDTKQTLRDGLTVTEGRDQDTTFGLGVEIHEVANHRLVGHSGHLAGQLTATLYDPDSDIAIAVACNAKEAPVVAMACGFFNALYHFIGTSSDVTHPTSFAGRFCNSLATVQVVQSGDSLLAIDPDDWDPFSWPETLEIVNGHQLRITTKGSVFNYGEYIDYIFAASDQKEVASIRFAGLAIPLEN